MTAALHPARVGLLLPTSEPPVYDDPEPGRRVDDNAHVLLRFDNIFGGGAGQIPLGSTILGATLRVESSGGNAQGDGGHMNRMLAPWTEAST